jgi:biopolymer transport protein ExbD
MARRTAEDASINMTPMIDVVFQLIIFFIVTLKVIEHKKEDIVLDDARYGPAIKTEETVIVIEVDRKGEISIHGVPVTRDQLRAAMKDVYDRVGNVTIQIRGDYRAQHKYIRKAMDTCAEVGLYKIAFQAVKERKVTTPPSP